MNRLFLLLFGMVTLVAHAQVPDYVPTEGLVAWYPFNGDLTNEVNQDELNLLIGGSFVPGQGNDAGGALSFLADSWAEIHPLIGTTEALTVHLWINEGTNPPNEIQTALYLGQEGFFGDTTSSLDITRDRINFPGDGRLRSNLNFDFGAAGFNELDGGWVHVVSVFDSGVLSIYRNGLLQQSTAASVSGISINGTSTLGAGHVGTNPEPFNFCHCALDNIGIWDRALTESEVLALYNSEPQVSGCTDPTACNYDEEATSDDGSCQAIDLCGICGGDSSSCVGCMDEAACNYNAEATSNDGTCIYPEIIWDTNSFCEDSLLSAAVIVPELTESQWALSFSYGDYVRIPLSESLANFPNGLTVECWYYQLGFSGGDETIVGHEYFAGEGFSLENTHGKWAGYLTGSDDYGHWDYWDSNDTNPPLNNGSWAHIALSYDGQVVRYFLNGELMDSNVADLGTVFSAGFSEDVVINRHTWGGGGSSSSRLSGYLDELRISNTARYASAFEPTSVEFQNDAFTVGLYHFNEEEGSIVLDASDYENHGQCNGTSWTENTVMVGVDESVEVVWGDAPGQDSISVSLDATGSVTAEIIGDGFSCQVSSDIPTVTLILGCTDATGCNYAPEATCDDESCTYPPFGLSDCDEGGTLCAEGTTWNSATQSCDPLPCEVEADAAACGPGTYWDELESLCLPIETCEDDLDGDGVIGVNDLMQLLSSFGMDCAPAGDTDDPSGDPVTAEFSCGDPVSYHGYDYATVQIGEQCWFAENLRTELYRNGASIPTLSSPEEWNAATDGARTRFGEWGTECAHDVEAFDACNPELALLEFGYLYNWLAVDDERALCPTEWHVPTESEWNALFDAVGGQSTASDALKSSEGWAFDGSGTQGVGFDAKPGAQRQITPLPWASAGAYGFWWSSTAPTASDAWGFKLSCFQDNVLLSVESQNIGRSIRCLKDQ